MPPTIAVVGSRPNCATSELATPITVTLPKNDWRADPGRILSSEMHRWKPGGRQEIGNRPRWPGQQQAEKCDRNSTARGGWGHLMGLP